MSMFFYLTVSTETIPQAYPTVHPSQMNPPLKVRLLYITDSAVLIMYKCYDCIVTLGQQRCLHARRRVTPRRACSQRCWLFCALD